MSAGLSTQGEGMYESIDELLRRTVVAMGLPAPTDAEITCNGADIAYVAGPWEGTVIAVLRASRQTRLDLEAGLDRVTVTLAHRRSAAWEQSVRAAWSAFDTMVQAQLAQADEEGQHEPAL